MKIKVINIRFIQFGIASFGVLLCALAIAPPAHAANAPSNLTVSGYVQHTYSEFGSTTQITVERGGLLEICTGFDNYTTIDAAITFSSSGSGGDGEISISPCLGSPGSETLDSRGITFNGAITLNAGGKIQSHSTTLKMNGALTANGHDLAVTAGGVSRLRGTGTLGNVSLSSGSAIAPGQSPGIINTGNLTFVSGSTYEFEIGGTTAGTGYDQINVTGTVDLGNGTLTVILYGGFKPSVGQSFTIINNDGSDSVTGTFGNLAEGKTFVSNGYAYTITYKGGSGNDVVLTVVPTPPNTGFVLINSNPVVIAAATIVAVCALVIIAHRLRGLHTGRL